MTAVACVRILVGEAFQSRHPEQFAGLVAKLAAAYLETTWIWPRRFGLIAPYSFALVDPRAVRLDARELQALARDLHRKMFGDRGAGEITLVMFEGSQSEILRFAGLERSQLVRILDGADQDFDDGRICRITPDEVASVIPKGGPVAGEPPTEALDDSSPILPVTGRLTYRGVFHTERQVFIGNVAVWREHGDLLSIIGRPDGETAEQDGPTIRAAAEALAALGAGVLFLPLSFSTLMKSSGRLALAERLKSLPGASRGKLAAAVYDTPRAPSYSGLFQMKQWLDANFSKIDLRVTDPAFEVETIPPHLVTSVTLVLPRGNEATRLAALAKFMGRSEGYRHKQIIQGVGDVCMPRELRACFDRRAPFITGPAVSDLMDQPIRSQAFPSANLPLREDPTLPGPVNSAPLAAYVA